MRYAILTLTLFCVAMTEQKPVRFLMPKVGVALAGARGEVTLYTQVWIERNPANRSYRVEWSCDGVRIGSLGPDSLDGEYASAIQPTMPARAVLTEGRCEFVAEVRGAGEKLLHRAVLPMLVCGSAETEC